MFDGSLLRRTNLRPDQAMLDGRLIRLPTWNFGYWNGVGIWLFSYM